ncbi:hypothetical protein Tco_0026993 [Tanacetum coccineum]
MEMMERFEEAIFKQREEINGRMAAMFRLLKELTASRTPEKKEKNAENNKVVDKNVIELSKLNALEPEEVVDMKKEVENRTDNEAIRSMKEEITGEGTKELVEMPRSQPIGYYLKHEINKELIEGLIGNQRYARRCKMGIIDDKGAFRMIGIEDHQFNTASPQVNLSQYPQFLLRLYKEFHKDHPIIMRLVECVISVQNKRMTTSFSEFGFLSAILLKESSPGLAYNAFLLFFYLQEEPKRDSKACLVILLG